MERLPEVLPLRPYFRERVWGGRRLQELYGKELPADRLIGESFEVSAYPRRQSVVAAGPLQGWSLGQLLATYREELVGRRVWQKSEGRFPLLIKLIDAQQDLSVQVHPDDRYAQARGLPDGGKMEAWFVLHATGGRVVHGLVEGVDRAAFEAAIQKNQVEEVLRFFAVQSGDVVLVPPGTVHALCRGVVVYEVQQPSDLTFRIYDYGRLDLDGRPRPLQLQEALEVIDFGNQPSGPLPWQQLPEAQADRGVLVESEYFRLNFYCPTGERVLHGAGESFLALTLVSGQARVSGKQGECFLRAGGTVLIPARREFAIESRADLPFSYLIAAAGV